MGRSENFRGTGKVYRFTLVQMIKGKANLLTLLFLILFAAASVPTATYFIGDGNVGTAGLSVGVPGQEAYGTVWEELGILPEQASVLASPYDVQVKTAAEYFEPERADYSVRYGLQLTYCILVMLLCSFAISYVIHRVIEEKASKLSEFLMVSVQPLALLLGKILAVMTYIFLTMLSVCAAFALSFAVTGQFMDTSVIAGCLSFLGITPDLLRLSPLTVAVTAISLLLGYAMFSLLSGLLGAGCSTTEDEQPASVAAVILLTAGYAVANSTVWIDQPLLTVLLCTFPFVSMYTMPMRYLTGAIGMPLVGISWLVQLLTIMLLAHMCAKIYRDLMLYRGSRIKIGGLFSMMRNGHGSKEARS